MIILGDSLTKQSDWTNSSVSFQINKEDLPDILQIGVILEGYGKAWADDLQIRIDGELYDDIHFRQEDLNHKEISWIKKYTIPILPEIKDSKKLLKSIDKACIVGLGEATHGSASIFEVKNNLAKMLITEGGFTLFAIEDGTYWGEVLNQYVLGKTDQLPSLNMNVMYTNKIFLEFVEWLRKYNKTAKKKVQIVGVDVTNRQKEIFRDLDSRTQNNFRDELLKINNSLEKAIEAWGEEGRYMYTTISLEDDEKVFMKNTAIEISNWVETNISDEQEKTLLLLYAHNLIQYTTLSKAMRDKSMADNIEFLLKRNPKEKIIYTAHNSHVGNSTYKDAFPGISQDVFNLPLFENKNLPEGAPYCGWYLKNTFGGDYYIISTCIYEGSNYLPATGKSMKLNKANPGSYEYLLNNAGLPNYFLDFRQIKKNKASEANWLQSKLFMRAAGSSDAGAKEFEIKNLTQEFDAVVFIKESVAL